MSANPQVPVLQLENPNEDPVEGQPMIKYTLCSKVIKGITYQWYKKRIVTHKKPGRPIKNTQEKINQLQRQLDELKLLQLQ